MHLLASIWCVFVFGLRVIALVGQASMQRVHVPQGLGVELGLILVLDLGDFAGWEVGTFRPLQVRGG